MAIFDPNAQQQTVKPFQPATGSNNRKKAIAYVNTNAIDANGNEHKLRGMPIYADGTFVEKQLAAKAQAHYENEKAVQATDPDYKIQPMELKVTATVQIVVPDEQRDEIIF